MPRQTAVFHGGPEPTTPSPTRADPPPASPTTCLHAQQSLALSQTNELLGHLQRVMATDSGLRDLLLTHKLQIAAVLSGPQQSVEAAEPSDQSATAQESVAAQSSPQLVAELAQAVRCSTECLGLSIDAIIEKLGQGLEMMTLKMEVCNALRDKLLLQVWQSGV